ncbi:MAG: PEP-utilizing enzyme [Bacteroidia bacterium]|jgi:pyruvate,water dikinase|nr:PEP-utilizing enzyme [Bacteroidia bacterium]
MIIYSDTSPENRSNDCGGKATNLFRLTDAGFPVPDFAVLPAGLLQSWMPENTADAGAFIHSFRIPAEIISALITRFGKEAQLAVRSSALAEDGSEQSFAGQYESYLHVTADTLEERIRDVWRSALEKRVEVYQQFHGIGKSNIAVIVQVMVNADAAGVGFGINPVSGNRNECVISAVWGLGEGLVSGELDADTFTVSAEKITEQLVLKPRKVSAAPNGGTHFTEVEKSLQNAATLSHTQLRHIAQWLQELKKLYGRAQDIEFALSSDKLFLLQTRPITTTSQLPDPEGEYLVWDNSNIIESYPGLTSPLTFSFIRKMYEAVYLQFTAMMGVKEEERNEHAVVYANMLGLLNGRVYYNLRCWYKLLSLLPGYQLNAEFMEKMMGVKERFTLTDVTVRSKFSERMRVLNMIRLLLKNQRQLPKMRRTFTRDFEAVMQEYDAIDFNRCRADELIVLYERFEQTLLKKWKAPLVNDFFAMIWYGVLQKLTAKYFPEQAATLHNDLLCGARDIVSTEPIRRIEEITKLIRSNEVWMKLLTRTESEVLKALRDKENEPVRMLVESYISAWGDRTVGELKLETITYRQQPELFIRVVAAALKQPETAHANLDLKLRSEAEAVVKQKLRSKPLKSWLFNMALRRSRDLVSNRENLRYARTRGFGMVRRIMIAIGHNFSSEQVIEEPRDIFWLRLDEIANYIRGTSDLRNLRELIRIRKADYARFETMPTAERIPTRGIVYAGNNFAPQLYTAEVGVTGTMLKGIGCCPGRITARVQVIHDPHSVSSLDGDILVTASTDPGWITLFPSASAILVERGSLLSHSAIVSREMGKPCIVGVSGLLQQLKTGDRVQMDGSTGEIIILES